MYIPPGTGDKHLHPHVVCEVTNVEGVQSQGGAHQAKGIGELPATTTLSDGQQVRWVIVSTVPHKVMMLMQYYTQLYTHIY